MLNRRSRGFTLIELLIVIGIVAILATITLLVLNPVEMLRKARDGKRISELKTISDAINLAIGQIPPLDIGSSLYVYVSLPDTSPVCANHNLPALTSGRTYQCATSANYKKTDGSGWVPVNLDSLPSRVLATLPVDPTNSNVNSAGLYYTYAPGSWELNAKMESLKYQSGGQSDIGASDGGDAPNLYEVGSRLTEIPIEINDRGGAPAVPDTTPPTVLITAPANLATISGSTSIGATATDDVAVAGVRFYYNSTLISPEDTSFPYSTSWDTTLVSDGSYTLTAIARDPSNNSTTSAIVNVTVNNGGGGDTTPPVISAISNSSKTTQQATIVWTTDESADSQIDYGLTSAYGSQTTLNASMVTSHSQTITGLLPNTLYHFRVRSMDAASNLASSTDNTFTTWPVPVLTNPGFESACSDDAVPPGWNVSVGGFAGVGCISTPPPGGAQSGARWIYAKNYSYAYQTLSLKSGVQYGFSVYNRQSDLYTNSSTLLISSAAGGGTSYCSSTSNSETWTPISCSYTPGSDMTVYFNLKGGIINNPSYQFSRFDNATTSAN